MKNVKRKVLLILAVVMASVLAGVMSVSAETETILFADFTDTSVGENLPMHKTNDEGARNNADRIKVNTEIRYGDAAQSGLWSVTGSNSALKRYAAPGVDVAAAYEYDNFVLRFYSSTATDQFGVLFYNNEKNSKGKEYYHHVVNVTQQGWQEVRIPVASINAESDLRTFKDFVVQKGNWGLVHNRENMLYFDTFFFEREISTEPPVVEPDEPDVPDVPERPMKDNQLLFADFTNPAVGEALPFHKTNDEGARHDGDRIRVDNDIRFADAPQSGRWAVTGSNSALNPYYVEDSGISLADAAKHTHFVLRLYSSEATDEFNILFYNTSGTYYRYPGIITKKGWQTISIPVSEIETKCKISEFERMELQKGGWQMVHNKQNKLYFDRFYFETKENNAIFDADDASLCMIDVANNNAEQYKTDLVYEGSTKSLMWYTSATSPRSLDSNTLSDARIDSTKYDKMTLRMYSTSYDELVVLWYYRENGELVYDYDTVYFSAADENIGKWIEYEIDLSYLDVPIEFIRLAYNSWETAHNADNNLYFDKIWFGDTEEIVSSFGYTQSAADGRQDVGVYEAIAFEFDSYLNETVPCGAVSVKRDSNPVTEFEAWTEGRKLYVKTDIAMKFDANYEITVTKALIDQLGDTLSNDVTISFKTEMPRLAMDIVKLTDNSGNVIKTVPAAGTTVNYSVEVINGSGEDKDFVGIIAMYKGDELLKVFLGDDVTFDADMAVPHTVKATGAVEAGTTKIKAFLWDGYKNVVPYITATEV